MKKAFGRAKRVSYTAVTPQTLSDHVPFLFEFRVPDREVSEITASLVFFGGSRSHTYEQVSREFLLPKRSANHSTPFFLLLADMEC
jgi:hypothetical protein